MTVRASAASFVAFLLLAAALPVACGDRHQERERAPERVAVRIDGLVINAEVARTPDERERGLSGRASLPRDEGMLFVFEEVGRHTFWMRGMRFALDFVWITDDGTVAEITPDVPPPRPNTPERELALYTPTTPVRYVLEVNAGLADAAGVAVGDAVTFDPLP